MMSDEDETMYVAVGSVVYVDKDYEAAFNAWIVYYALTESYDRLLPGYLTKYNEWIPLERSDSSLFAENIRNKTIGRLRCDKSVILAAKNRAVEVSYSETMPSIIAEAYLRK